GEISEEEKSDFLGNAAALLFPIDWPEPFGLVMIEAMACGTPVVAFRQGAVPEVVDHGRSGFVVTTIEEAVQAVEDALQLDRALVRQMFGERRTVSRMGDDCVATYGRVREQWPVLTP